MRWVRWIFAWTLAVLWLPTMSHCALEQLGWLSATPGVCCDADDHGDQHESAEACAKDLCQTLESGAIKHGAAVAKAPRPALIVCLFQLVTTEPAEVLAPKETWVDRPVETLLNTWQFAARAALSPRAPSLS